MVHIYTRVQEELEKKAKPAVGLLHKLLRMIDEVSQIASSIYINIAVCVDTNVCMAPQSSDD